MNNNTLNKKKTISVERAELGERIRVLRQEHNLSSEELAKRVGKSQNSILAWERGESRPKLDSVIKLAHILGCETGHLTNIEHIYPGKEETDISAATGLTPSSIQILKHWKRNNDFLILDFINHLILSTDDVFYDGLSNSVKRLKDLSQRNMFLDKYPFIYEAYTKYKYTVREDEIKAVSVDGVSEKDFYRTISNKLWNEPQYKIGTKSHLDEIIAEMKSVKLYEHMPDKIEVYKNKDKTIAENDVIVALKNIVDTWATK